MTIEVSAFRWVPDFAQGYVKDLRVRWALEEAGIPYQARLIDAKIQASADYRQWQPFGQVPGYRDDEVEMFESGAVVLHIAAKSEALAPRDEAGKARMTTWVLAALNSVEPQAQNWIQFDPSDADEASTKQRRAKVEARLNGRLAALAAWLGDKPYLEGRFTAGDLMMGSVLRELVDGGALKKFPNLDTYVSRCEARPAFGRALAAQMQAFAENAPA